MDIQKMRDHFPIFKNCPKDMIYFDNAATSQRPQNVIDAVTNFYSAGNASVHRGVYDLSEKSTGLFEAAREKVAKFINAADVSEIVFNSGTTDGINSIADTWASDNIKEGDEIVVTQAEHHANLLPWQRLAKRNGAKLRFIKVDLEQFLMVDPDDDLINSKTKLVSVVHSSNVLGNIWKEGQLESIIKRAHDVGAKFLLDCAQSIPHQKFDVQELNPDFVVFSGHKMLAPTGLGVLYIKKELHDAVEPYRVGGSMVHDATYEEAHWQAAPGKFEAGTPAIAQVIGMGAAIDFFNEHVNFDEVHKYEAELCVRLFDGLKSIEGVKILGHHGVASTNACQTKITPLAAFVVDGVHAHDVSAMLGMRGIATRAGHHCVQPLAKLMGIEASARASLYLYNTLEEVDVFVRELDELVKKFRSS